MTSPSMLDRYVGTALASACGDALGSTLEFGAGRPTTDLLRDLVGGGPFRWAPGSWTDDTDMAVAVAEGILEEPEFPVHAIGLRFLAWYGAGPRDVGGTCGRALAAARAQLKGWRKNRPDKIDWSITGVRGEFAAGNGALMRTWPVALAYRNNPRQMDDMARRVAWMTHNNAVAADSCVLMCQLLSYLIDGISPSEAVQRSVEDLETDIHFRCLPDRDKTWLAAIRLAPHMDRLQVPRTGYTVDTLVAAVWALTTTDSLEECVVQAANLGGDADSIGAVAGALAGACYGAHTLPSRWLGVLQGGDRLAVAAHQLYKLGGDQNG